MAIVRSRIISQVLQRSSITTCFGHQKCSASSTAAVAAAAEVGVVGSKSMGFWLKDYEDYRKSLYGGNITHKALFVDAVGTLLVPAQPTAQVSFSLSSKLLTGLIKLSSFKFLIGCSPDFLSSLLLLFND